MRIRNVGKTLILSLLLLLVADTIDAQRSRSRRTRPAPREREDRVDQELTPWYAISLGTVGFGSGFSISGKYSYGYKLKNFISIGAQGKAFYELVNFVGIPDVSLFSYGAGAFTRLSITDEIFLQGEYNYTSFAFFQGQNPTRDTFIYPSIGGGYKAGYGDWTYGFHLQIALDETVRDINNLEYWIDFNYKF